MSWIKRPFLLKPILLKAQRYSHQDANVSPRRWKPFIFGVALPAVISILYSVGSIILLGGFIQVERQATQRQVEQVLDMLDMSLKSLDSTTRDYASWDDTYTFVQNLNSEYIQVNLTETVFTTFNLNLIAFLDSSNDLVYGLEWNARNQELVELSKQLQSELSSKPALDFYSAGRHFSILIASDRAFLIAARPILTSEGKGPAQGILIMGRQLDAAEIKRLAEMARVSVSLHHLDQLLTSVNPQVIQTLALNSDAIVVDSPNDDWVEGYTVLEDLSGKPALLLQIRLPRTIYKQGLLSLRSLGLSLLIIGMLFGWIIWLLTKRLTSYIAERDRMEQALLKEKELAQTTLQSIGDGVITTDADGRIQFLNPVAEKLTGWQTEAAQGLSLLEVFRVVDEETREPAENLVEKALQEKRIITAFGSRNLLIAKSREEFAIDASVSPIQTSEGHIVGTVLVFWDVTHARQIARQLSWQASYDALTGLMNRREFECRLGQAIVSAQLQHQEHTFCFLDLDRFKLVNDTCGHIAGDELLRQISSLLQSKIRKSDIAARLGGDEFGVLLYQCTVEQATPLAQLLCRTIQEFRFVWQEKVFTVGVSIGLVAVTAESNNLNQLLIAADSACYAAKNRGRGQVYIYQADEQEQSKQRSEMHWVAQINRAFTEDRFQLYYQMIEPIAPGHGVGDRYEVLLRMVGEQDEMIVPGAFLSTAERHNLMATIDRWVIYTLFASQKEQYQHHWNSRHTEKMHCLYMINLSRASIHDEHFIEFLRQQLIYHHIPAQFICFEISEAILSASLSQMTEFIEKLKSLGCLVAIDDFGSSLSSFAYLKTLPIDYLKIDGALIQESVDDPIAQTLLDTINRIGHLIGVPTIAKFVADEAIRSTVIAAKVDYAQGYLIAEPRPLTRMGKRSLIQSGE